MQEMTTYSLGIYARLSRNDERCGESVSMENQKEMLTRYVKEQGWTLYSYYCDEGVDTLHKNNEMVVILKNLMNICTHATPATKSRQLSVLRSYRGNM